MYSIKVTGTGIGRYSIVAEPSDEVKLHCDDRVLHAHATHSSSPSYLTARQCLDRQIPEFLPVASDDHPGTDELDRTKQRSGWQGAASGSIGIGCSPTRFIQELSPAVGTCQAVIELVATGSDQELPAAPGSLDPCRSANAANCGLVRRIRRSITHQR